MEEHDIKICRWLYPVSWLYGAGVRLRNKLFDWGWLRSRSFDIPVICVGNLAVGGTGKTPHTEYLIKLLLKNKFHVASLSRGYKRKTKGYLLADAQSDAARIGDEPFQIKCKYPEIRVAVDENRCHGIEQLLRLDNPPVDVVVLDDAFQHRYVKAGLNVLLTDYQRLLCDDALLPAGRLREPATGKHRAHIIIVTKCPEHIKPIDFNIVSKQLNLYPYQHLFFSRLRYGRPYPLFLQTENTDSGKEQMIDKNTWVLLLTGIASPSALLEKIKAQAGHVESMAFKDHHDFHKKDLQLLKDKFEQHTGSNKLIVTTEKDAARLKGHPHLDDSLKPYIYVLPIEIEFLQNQQDIFNQKIIGYVRTNSRNSGILKRKNAYAT